MSNEFDLDVNFEDAEPDLSSFSKEQLAAEIKKLPEAIPKVAYGLIIEERTMSDVSQELGIRQAGISLNTFKSFLEMIGFSNPLIM